MIKYITALVLLVIVEITLSGYLVYWREHFWNSISNKDSHDFLFQVGLFLGLALIYCVVSGLSGYLLNLTSIEWRKQLNCKALRLTDYNFANVEQRIQEDCKLYPELVLNLIFGSLKSGIYIVVFSVLLLLDFSWWILGILVLYSIIGTTIAHKIAAKLLILNYNSQNAEATYRKNFITYDLTISPHSMFGECIKLMFSIAKKQKHLNYFQSFYNQLVVVVPILLIAPLYFTTGMTLGMLMRFNSTAMTIVDNASYGINSYGIINNMRASRNRLKEIGIL